MGLIANIDVGVGFCDLCMTRLFEDETLYEKGSVIICEHCAEDYDEEALLEIGLI